MRCILLIGISSPALNFAEAKGFPVAFRIGGSSRFVSGVFGLLKVFNGMVVPLAVVFVGAVLVRGSSTILALGDSITEGAEYFVCYRQVMLPELKERGIAAEFIGPRKDATSAHAGYSGKNTHYLRSILDEVYRQHPADIVLLHSGHNSFSRDEPVPGIVCDTRAIIESLERINPDVMVLLAQVIPSGKLPKYSYIPELNRELELLAEELSARGSAVVLVNQADGFDWKSDTVEDRVHPNASGARKMAAKWIAALEPILNDFQKSKARPNMIETVPASSGGGK